jgi:polyisoprenoid-binding protein YceI
VSRSNSRPLSGPFLLVGLLLVAVAGAGGLWYFFLRPAAPPPVLSSQEPSSSASSTAGATAAASPASGSPSGGSPTATPPGQTGSGVAWTVDRSIGSFSDFSGSFAGYRVQEQLVNVGGNTAVGRTPDVTGSLTLDGTTVTSASFSVQLASLRSDDDRRDGRVDEALSVGRYPAATFTLDTPIELGSLPAEGQEIKATAAGKLTIRGVTRDVQFPLTATLNGGVLTIKGALEIRFADYSVPKPTSFSVLSIADTGTIEVQLQMTRGT